MIHAILNTNINIAALLHGEQKITLHRPIPPKGVIKTTGGPMSAYDKGDKGALVNCEFKSVDEEGEPLFDNKIVLIDRSAGNHRQRRFEASRIERRGVAAFKQRAAHRIETLHPRAALVAH